MSILKIHSKGQEVERLQKLLNSNGAIPQLVPDGNFGSLTQAAVKRFQALKGLNGDGIVGPSTWAALEKNSSQPVSPPEEADTQQNAIPDDYYFPLAKRPSPDWTGGSRYFGANRDKKDKETGRMIKRLHAGCDLLADPGTSIYAIADGVLVRGAYGFTSIKKGWSADTQAVEVRHGGLLIRYGEIKPGSYVGGDNVTKGQVIAKVGGLKMLHFEVYTNGESKASLNGGGLYHRRSDVTNPAPYLEKWVKNLPTK